MSMKPFDAVPVAVAGVERVKVVQFPGLATVPSEFWLYVFETWTENEPNGFEPVQEMSYEIWESILTIVTAEMMGLDISPFVMTWYGVKTGLELTLPPGLGYR